VTGGVCENIAQNVAQPICCQNEYITHAVVKGSQWKRATSVFIKNKIKNKK
jgi:hypothetical protein